MILNELNKDCNEIAKKIKFNQLFSISNKLPGFHKHPYK